MRPRVSLFRQAGKTRAHRRCGGGELREHRRSVWDRLAQYSSRTGSFISRGVEGGEPTQDCRLYDQAGVVGFVEC